MLAPSPVATNYLIVGTDSRAGVDPSNPNAGVIFGEAVQNRIRNDEREAIASVFTPTESTNTPSKSKKQHISLRSRSIYVPQFIISVSE